MRAVSRCRVQGGRLPDDAGISLGASATKDHDTKTGQARLGGIVVKRAMSPVMVDGKLDEWNDDGMFRAVLPGSPGEREWVEGRMMFDDDGLDVAARVGDPLPMRNSIDPELDAGVAWRVGGLQIFFSGDSLAAARELHYSDETGKLWRSQVIEIRNQTEPRGILLYERAATWGRADFR